MPPSQFAYKDPQAVARGKGSAKARRIKTQETETTPMKIESSISPSSSTSPSISMEVDPLPSVHNQAFAIVNSTSGKKIIYNSHIPPEEQKRLKRKVINADEFFLEATRARKRLKADIFNSALSQEELNALDLSANSKLFPEIVNSDTDLRKRPLREHERATNDGRFIKRDKLLSGETGEKTTLQAVTTIPTRTEIAAQLQDKSKWFRDIEKAAAKQAEAYEGAATEVTNSMTNDDKNRDDTRAVIPTSGLEAFLNDDIPRLRQFSRDEWRSRQNALLSHVHAIAENYRQELSGLTMYVNKAIKSLDKANTSAATLLWHLNEHGVHDIDLEAWSITEAAEDSHRCECTVCQGREAAEELTPIGLLQKEFEKNKQETIDAREALVKEEIWKSATVAKDAPEEERTSAKVTLLQEKWDRWFLERERTIERNHAAFLRRMGEQKAHIEWEMNARKYNLASYENELKRLSGEQDGSSQSPQTTQLLEAIDQCRGEITEDQKMRDIDLDVDEFVELYSVPVEEREGWLAERQERVKNSPPEKAILRAARKSLQRPLESSQVEWKSPREIQDLYEHLPMTNIREMDRYRPLFENQGLPVRFDFCSNEVWGEVIHGQD